MTNNKKYLFYQILLIATLSVYVTFANLGISKNFIGDDAGLKYYNGVTLSEQMLFMWDDLIFPGVSNVLAPFGLLYSSIVVVLQEMGFTNIVVERIQYFSFFFFSALGFLFLLKSLRDDSELTTWAQLVITLASLNYAFNNFTVIFTSFPQHNYHLSYILFPWVFYFFINFYKKKAKFTSTTLFAISVLLYLGGNISNTISGLFILLAYASMFTKNALRKMKYMLLLVLEILLLTAFIYTPILSSSHQELYTNIDSDTNIDSLGFNSTTTSLVNVSRFLGYHSLNSLDYGKYFSANPFFIIMSFYIPILLILYLRNTKVTNNEKFALILLLISIFLAKGKHEPLASVFLFIFYKIPYFQMFRAVYYKFVPYIVFSSLILVSYALISFERKDGKHKTCTILIYALSIIVTAWPLFHGQAVRKFHLTEVPESYQKLSQYVDKNMRYQPILSLPQSTEPILSWGEDNFYTSYSIQLNLLTRTPVWNWTYFNKEIRKFLENTYSVEDIVPLMKIFHVKYVLLQKDIPEEYYFNRELNGRPEGYTKYLKYKESIDHSNEFELLVDTDYFTLYEIQNAANYSIISVPEQVYVKDHLQLTDILEYYETSNTNAVYIDSESLADTSYYKSTKNISGCTDIGFEYEKINSSKYTLQMKTSCEIVPILFSQNFDTNWKFAEETKSVSEYSTHLKGNHYANFWLFNLKKYCEDNPCNVDVNGKKIAKLDMVFDPQKYFNAALIVSCSTLLFLTGTLLFNKYVRHVD